MTHFTQRRTLVAATITSPFLFACTNEKIHANTHSDDFIYAKLTTLEKDSGGRIGLAAWNTANDARIAHRATERFPMCSTFKVLAAGAILTRSAKEPDLLEHRIHYDNKTLVTYSPITEQHVSDGMTIAELCIAALRYSDNTAANLLLEILGGPAAITAYARSLGDEITQLDRNEPTLNTAIPGDPRDTTTPVAMVNNWHRLLLSDALQKEKRMLLDTWLAGNTTGDQRIRAGVPTDWRVGDKTGSGDYGTTNDVAILRPPGRAPILLAIYYAGSDKPMQQRNAVIASAAQIITTVFS